MRVLVTGSAGFIGSTLVLRLLDRGDFVVGIDNHTDYYDKSIKEARLGQFASHPNYTHIRADIADRTAVDTVFRSYRPSHVVNLAAQAGVRYSIENPLLYIDSNIVGFAHILEGCRTYDVEHLVYASSSSVYGANANTPFSVHHNVDHPLSLYAASKKSNELMAHTYSHLFGLSTTGLRLFTVYGPWGRPDMALHKFTTALIDGRPLQVFNHGHHRRDFTYIDDVIESITRVLDRPAVPNSSWRPAQPDPATSAAPWRVYNLGNSNPVELLEFIAALEVALDKKAEIELLDMQPGDMAETYADVSDTVDHFEYRPTTPIIEGVAKFVHWYRHFYQV